MGEGLSMSGRIHCSEIAARLLKEQAPEVPVRKRGKVTVKGKGNMVTYWVGVPNHGRLRKKSVDSDDMIADTSIDQTKSDGSIQKGRIKWTRQIVTNINLEPAIDDTSNQDMADSAPASWTKWQGLRDVSMSQ